MKNYCMQRIYLIGYMGAGKTTLGAPLAKKLGLSFIDIDKFIEKRYHKSINELFTVYGEKEFRNIEKKILKEVSEFENVVISTGGGTPCFSNNMDLMKSTGLTVFLDVSQSTLFSRLKQGKHKRPKLRDKNDEELRDYINLSLSERIDVYRRCSISFNADNLESFEAIEKATKELGRIVLDQEL